MFNQQEVHQTSSFVRALHSGGNSVSMVSHAWRGGDSISFRSSLAWPIARASLCSVGFRGLGFRGW